MTSKEALIYVKMCCSDGLQLPQNQSLEQVKLIGASIETIKQDLDRLEKLEKVIEILKNCVYLIENELIHNHLDYLLILKGRYEEIELDKEEYDLLKEWLENE